jgi:hypothetical protein
VELGRSKLLLDVAASALVSAGSMEEGSLHPRTMREGCLQDARSSVSAMLRAKMITHRPPELVSFNDD